MRIQRSIRLSPEADEALRVIAHRQERSVSQLIELAVRSHYIGRSGERSMDGRESESTKAARERGAYDPGSDPEALVLPKPSEARDGGLRRGRPQRHEFGSGEEWQAATRAWKAER